MAKKEIVIKLYVSELIYNIQAQTHLTAESKSNLPPEVVATMKAGEDELSHNQILRSIGNAIASLRGQLSEYISVEQKASSNILLDEETNKTLTITLNKLTSNFNEATTEDISALAHQFIVNTALMDWFLLTSPQDAGEYSKLAMANAAELRNMVNKRTRPVRKEVTEG